MQYDIMFILLFFSIQNSILSRVEESYCITSTRFLSKIISLLLEVKSTFKTLCISFDCGKQEDV